MTADAALDRRARGDRRTRRVSMRYPERRSGFDRRTSRPFLEAYRARPAAIGAVLAAFVLLNVADLVFTLRVVDAGAIELNPVMAALLGAGSGYAAAFKLGAALTVAGAMWAARRYRLVLQASLAALALMGAVAVYQGALAASLW